MNEWIGPTPGRRQLSTDFFLAAALIVTAMSFGGASRLHAVPLAVVELASVPALLWGSMRLFQSGDWRGVKAALGIALLLAIIPMMQLVPLPFNAWSNLPGREAAATVAALTGITGWARVTTLAPHETLSSLLALMPPIAMFVLTVRLGVRERSLIVGLIMIAVAANLTLGVGQVVVSNAAYLYENTSRGFAVGLFSNRNHYAVLLVCALPLAAILLLLFGARHRNAGMIMAVAATVVLLLVVIGVVMGRSRAALGLLVPALAAAVFIVARWGGGVSRRPVYIVLGVAGVALAAGLAFGLRPLLERFGTQAAQDIRFASAPEILRRSVDYLPLGSGVGSFEQVYQSFEPVRLIGPEFLNHAHNDFLEMFLEAGVAALLVLLLFLVWWGLRLRHALKSAGPYGDLAVAGATVTGILMLHSLVDYPLRTSALATLFAFGCGLLATSHSLRAHQQAQRSTGVEPTLRIS